MEATKRIIFLQMLAVLLCLRIPAGNEFDVWGLANGIETEVGNRDEGEEPPKEGAEEVPTNVPEKIEGNFVTSTPEPVISEKICEGMYVTFGSYEQDASYENGPEPIEWLVLEQEENSVFLIAKYGLDKQKYHSHKYVNDDVAAGVSIEVTWEECDIRKWLNDDFYYSAFTSEERSGIRLTKVNNSEGRYGANGGNDTFDRVFLLSTEEAVKYFGSAKNYKNVKAATTPTEYALAEGLSMKNFGEWCDNNCDWWLRSRGQGGNWASYIAGSGILMENGSYVTGGLAVRPVLWVDADKVRLATKDREKTER